MSFAQFNGVPTNTNLSVNSITFADGSTQKTASIPPVEVFENPVTFTSNVTFGSKPPTNLLVNGEQVFTPNGEYSFYEVDVETSPATYIFTAGNTSVSGVNFVAVSGGGNGGIGNINAGGYGGGSGSSILCTSGFTLPSNYQIKFQCLDDKSVNVQILDDTGTVLGDATAGIGGNGDTLAGGIGGLVTVNTPFNISYNIVEQNGNQGGPPIITIGGTGGSCSTTSVELGDVITFGTGAISQTDAVRGGGGGGGNKVTLSYNGKGGLPYILIYVGDTSSIVIDNQFINFNGVSIVDSPTVTASTTYLKIYGGTTPYYIPLFVEGV
jgi:hypothetical protein